MNQILEAERQYQDKKITDNVRSDYSVFYEDNVEVLKYVENLLSKCSGRILIYGCGDKDITEFIDKGFAEVVGIDISPKSVEKINLVVNKKGLADKVKCLVMDAQDLKFPDGYFDVVFGTGILHHLDIGKAMGEISRILTKDGKMIFMEPLGLNPLINLYRRKTPEARTEYEHPLVLNDFKIIRNHFNIETKGFYLLTILSFWFRKIVKSDFLYKISRYAFLKLDFLFLFLFPFLKYYCWIIVIIGARSDFEQ